MAIETNYKELSYDEWEETYSPISNPINSRASFEGRMFETYGEDLEFVEAYALKTDGLGVWTLVDGDEDEMIIGNGFHFVNRIGYFLTEKTYDEDIQIDVILD